MVRMLGESGVAVRFIAGDSQMEAVPTARFTLDAGGCSSCTVISANVVTALVLANVRKKFP